MRKHEASKGVEPAIEQPEVADEVPITLSKEKSVSPESHQEESEPQTQNGASGSLTTQDYQEYQTRSGRISVKPARFNDYVMD